MDDGCLSGNFHGFHGKQSPAFCKKHVELGVFNSLLVFKRVVFVCFCRLSGSRISVLNRKAWISVWLLLNKKHQSLNFGMSPKMFSLQKPWSMWKILIGSWDTAPFWWDSLSYLLQCPRFMSNQWAVMVAKLKPAPKMYISSKSRCSVWKIKGT